MYIFLYNIVLLYLLVACHFKKINSDGKTTLQFSFLIKGAVVGLERTSYQTAEGVGVVEVCVIVYSPSQECPIAFPFIINLSTGDHNAGIISV